MGYSRDSKTRLFGAIKLVISLFFGFGGIAEAFVCGEEFAVQVGEWGTAYSNEIPFRRHNRN